jgi:N-acetylglucosaminyldiphosphoundecaprenol N-acetyl-beta-D-mannosaminyltransferase
MRKEFSQRRPDGFTKVDQFPEITVNYNREVFNIFGLVFDSLGSEEVLDRMAFCATASRRCHLATPNANMLRIARSDPEFRDALLSADLSTLDGMPLVLLARIMGLPASRVSGADVFEALQRRRDSRLRAFFFGGDEATSERLVETLNNENSGIVCVGALSPAYGPIDNATTKGAIATINKAEATLLSVSLGARKGVLWIVRNERELRTPIIANLGAVIHFATGAIPRAPIWMRRAALEWLWRIRAEPALFSRYARDAMTLATVSFSLLLPSLVLSTLLKLTSARQEPRIQVASDDRGATISLGGTWRGSDLTPLREALAFAETIGGAITFDLSHLRWIDADGLGLMLVAYGAQRRRGRTFSLHAASYSARATLYAQGCGFLLSAPPRHV